METTEQDAIDAVAALYINVNTGEDAEVLPEQNRNTVFAALGLQRIVTESELSTGEDKAAVLHMFVWVRGECLH